MVDSDSHCMVVRSTVENVPVDPLIILYGGKHFPSKAYSVLIRLKMIFKATTDLRYLIVILELGNLLLFICASYRDIGILYIILMTC